MKAAGAWIYAHRTVAIASVLAGLEFYLAHKGTDPLVLGVPLLGMLQVTLRALYQPPPGGKTP